MKRKLIEVALPLEVISEASAREKSIRHGHPFALHLWWARRPLAACRAVLFAQLVDDPSSHPDRFPDAESQFVERQRLFAIIKKLVKWENTTDEKLLAEARTEIRRSCGGKLPIIHDPFSGGCSIPLEAQRLGLPAHGSDLNPVAVLIGKATIEIPPRFKPQPCTAQHSTAQHSTAQHSTAQHRRIPYDSPVHPGAKERQFYENAQALAEDVRHYGNWIREQAFQRIGHLYPKITLPPQHGSGEATVVAWLWARTVPSPDPAFNDAPVPLVSSFLISSKEGKEVRIEPIVDKHARSIRYTIHKGGSADEIKRAREGTKTGRGIFRCLLSDAVIPARYIRERAKAGEMKATLIAIVADGNPGRIYVAPAEEHEQIALSVLPQRIPSELVSLDKRAISPPTYGMTTFGDLFTHRQLVALNTLSDLVHEARNKIQQDAITAGLPNDAIPLRDGGTGAKAYAEAVSIYLTLLVGQISKSNSSICSWIAKGQSAGGTFARPALPITWDYAEVNIFSSSTGSFNSLFDRLVKGFETLGYAAEEAQVKQVDARSVAYAKNTAVATDPPYYDNVGYADLSDFFYVWLRSLVKDIYPETTASLLTPKTDEIVASAYRHGGKAQAETYFLDGMKAVMQNAAQQISSEFPTTIYYAFKQKEIAEEGIISTGWVTFLQALVEAGFSVTGTWPVLTEKPGRPRAVGANALASSIVLACRKREETAETITRPEFFDKLKTELPAALAQLQEANIAPADMPQSAIGPGIAIFSRYKAVLEADDSIMTVKDALQRINTEIDAHLTDIEGDFDPQTRFAITWFRQHATETRDFGSAETLATARGISVAGVQQAGIIESRGGKVRIIKHSELDPEWLPPDANFSVWQGLHQLIRAYEKYSVSNSSAKLFDRLRPKSTHIKELAYCLYEICTNTHKDAAMARPYNDIISDWKELLESDYTEDHQTILDIPG